MLKDIALFAQSVLHSIGVARPRRDYWDTTDEKELNHVVALLSHTNDPERVRVRAILNQLQARTLLDAGCGPATELAGYKQAGMRIDYTGIDGSVRMLSHARQRNPEARFVRGALEKLPFADRSFEVVLLKHILEHQGDYRPLLREAVRVADRAVIVNHFHRLLPLSFNIRLKDRRGFYNNWYSRPSFEGFVKSLGVRKVEHQWAPGASGQTAEFYILHRAR